VAHRDYCIIADDYQVPELLSHMYGKGVHNQYALQDRHQRTIDTLDALLNQPKVPRKNKNSLTEAIDSKTIVKQEDFTNDLPSFCSDEFFKLARMTTQTEVEMLHTKEATWLRVAGSNAEPQEEIDVFSQLFS
jgi:hypothetical protein